MRNFRLLIVQPYLPSYRVGFFQRLIDALAEDSITCLVSAAPAQGLVAHRNDSVEASWAIATTRRRVKVPGGALNSYGSAKVQHGADGIIAGLQGTLLDSNLAIASRWTRGKRVGLWGHVRSYTSTSNALDRRIEQWQATHSDHIFAYTLGGARQAELYGVPAERITAVMNSVDVSSTLQAVADLSADESSTFQAEHGLQTRKTASFIGGLDSVKRIGFLADALDEIWTLDRDFKLLVGGGGADAHLLEPSAKRGQTIMVGYAGPREKALFAKSSSVMAMPGRVGLVAVEGLALGLPIVTTDWPFHAPEAEYLVEGTSVFTSDDSPSAFAELLLEAARSQSERPALVGDYPKVSDMVENFRRGILRMIG